MVHRVSLVLRLTDGFRGQPITSAAMVRVSLNGRITRPVYKTGGWFVFVDLPAGQYHVRAAGPGFCPVELEAVVTEGDGYPEFYCELSAAGDYPFGPAAARFHGLVVRGGAPVAGQEVLLVRTGNSRMKIAEDGPRAGRQDLRLFLASRAMLQSIPGEFLLMDREESETVVIREAEKDIFRLNAPLRYAHKRGIPLQPAQRLCTGTDGRFFAAFQDREEREAYLPLEGGYRRFPLELNGELQTVSL